jgi:hypothetical protein
MYFSIRLLICYHMLYITIDGPRIDRIDPTHPTLRGFRLSYQWENVQTEDFDLAKKVLLASTLGLFIFLFFYTFYESEREDMIEKEAAAAAAATNTNTNRRR